MAENYLITGYWGEPHVTVENDRGINAAIFGAGRFVLPVGEQFRAEYIGNNTVRVYDGKLIDNGAVAGIPAGQYIDLLIPEAGQGMKRNDLIIFQYSKDASTLVERGVFVVVNGVETGEPAANDPDLTQQDILSDTATVDQMALWRVAVEGSVISAPEKLFSTAKSTQTAGNIVVEAISTDGVNYEATVECVDELYTGLEITIIPNKTSTSTAAMLNVNGLGAKRIRMPISSSTSATTTPTYDDFYAAKKPVKLIYDASSLNGIWRIVDKNRANAVDLYGTVPIKLGGTGADNAPDAVKNLNIYPIDSIYITYSSVSPASLFGGSWVELSGGQFLLTANGHTMAPTYNGETIGGSADAVVVKHNHTFQVRTGTDLKNAYNYASLNVAGSTYNYPAISAGAKSDDAGGITLTETGVDGTGKNMPPWIAMHIWHRIA